MIAVMELLRHVTIGQFVPSDSIVHRIDPRVKIGLLFVAMTVAFTCQHVVPLLLTGLLCIALARLASLGLRYFLSGLRPVALLLAITVVFNLFMSHDGKPLLKAGPLLITTTGVHFALLMGLRLTMLFLMTSLFTLTTSPIRLTDALEYLMWPLAAVGVSTGELSMMVSIAIRFIPTLVETTEKIMKAQLSRGARFDEGSTVARTRATIAVLVPLFVCAFTAADTLAEAMESRCWRGGVGRTRLVTLQCGPVDALAVVVGGMALLAVCATDYVHWHGWL